ncbi:cysteine protease ATG4A-like isoform X1 [Sinocyclocheilus grahami]|uniref:Cysteine protease n=1 Tax=Sinocyclocheilus grahami TaxID=75366 RepID=A0A672QZK4_SINGR|nr:PREDICTED: cysteine protease ATG4A-like isoform X1 [Sinocyclocheilus grahami]
MEAVLAKYENQINVFSEFLEDLPDVDEPVWILGACYDLKTKKPELLSDVRSRLWFTYRKKFSPIGGTGPSSDAGWGCMLRCGQMILAQALVSRHLGRDWRWDAEKRQPKEYHRILHCFLDKKDSCYSIHQMAQMGVGEGKSVGEWYGPNTVAQVLKKLALFDDWNTLAVYVSMDNTVVIEDIKKQCKQPGRESRSRAGPCGQGEVPASGQSCSEAQGKTLNLQSQRPLDWRPLLLVIPLRMGINSINPVYIQAFKECFKMPQSCGVLGGKPNLAYYFIGFIDDELIYLDPHTTQQAVDTDSGSAVDDQSYHCQRTPHRMKITSLDPSVALGFFCKSEEDFDSWCDLVQQELLKKRNLRMFELVEKHPSHWPPFVPPTKPEVQTTGAEFIESPDKLFESEEEFEILNV